MTRIAGNGRFIFQFARAAADHFLRKNLRNLRSGTMVATVACRYFPSAKRRSPVFTWQFRFRMTKKNEETPRSSANILTCKC